MLAASRARFLVFGLTALFTVLALPGGAFAAKPGFHDKFDDTFPDSICGVDGTSHVTGTQTGTDTGTSFRVSGEVTQVFTATDGRTVRLHSAGIQVATFTDNGDGTTTVVSTYKGLPEQISGAKGGPVVRDAGLITIIVTFDQTTGDVISFSVVATHGPHPEADSDFTLFCDAFLTALG